MADDQTSTTPAPQVYPWHRAVVDRLEATWRQRRIPHALLLHGADGLGKRALAAWIARSLLCEGERPGVAFCGQCSSCQLAQARTHPDFQWINPEEDKQQISIDQVRQACERLSKTSGRHGWKIAVLEPAHQLTPAAANSLLKTLEEPSQQSLLMLVTSRPAALPITIRSRCQQWLVPKPDAAQLAEWSSAADAIPLAPELLEFCAGAPVDALEYARDGRFDDLNQRMRRAVGDLLTASADPTQIAQAWNDDRLPERLKWLDLWLCHRMRALLAGNDELITFPMRRESLPSTTGALNITAVYTVIDRIRLLRAQLSRTAVQKELAIESLLFELMHAMRPGART